MSTNNHRVACRLASLVAVLTFALPTASALAQDSKSKSAAKLLADTLDRLKLESIAAPDPSDKDTFVAALYFQGAQLLVVSARYAVPSLLVTKLDQKDYRDVYIDLSAASIAGSKVFIMDQGADGLVANPGDGVPDSWEQSDKTLAFDGDGKSAKMSEDAYRKAFADADERYARILTLLAEQARKTGS